jgi:ribonuclease P protein component
VVYVPAGEGTVPRVGYAIGRSVGGAVVRNRIRRQLRSALVAAHLAPGAYLIVASPAATTLGFEALQSAVTEAARSAAQSAVQPVTV